MTAIVVIVIARMGSSRLPGKTLMTVEGQPLLQHLLLRLRRVRGADRVVVATSTEIQDNPVAALCERLGVPVFRGSESDTMDRFHGAAEAFNADVAVRITGDCPLIDPATVDLVIDVIQDSSFDYVSTDLVPQYPNGMGCDAYARPALDRLHAASRELDPDQSWMLTRDSAMGLKCGLAPASRFGDLSRYRVTVDTPEDFDLVSRIIAALPMQPDYGLDDVVALLEQHPDWAQINAGVVQKTGPHRRMA